MKRIGLILLILVLIIVGFLTKPWNVFVHNKYEGLIKEVDSATNWETLHEVEDSCRAMMSNYQADVLTYQQYCNSEIAEQRSWAEQARMRANRTAAQYNEYILKNNYVWKYGIPDDIEHELPYI